MATVTEDPLESPVLSEFLHRMIKCYKSLQLVPNRWVNKAVQP